VPVEIHRYPGQLIAGTDRDAFLSRRGYLDREVGTMVVAQIAVSGQHHFGIESERPCFHGGPGQINIPGLPRLEVVAVSGGQLHIINGVAEHYVIDVLEVGPQVLDRDLKVGWMTHLEALSGVRIQG